MNSRFIQLLILHVLFYVALPSAIGLLLFDVTATALSLCAVTAIGFYLTLLKVSEQRSSLIESKDVTEALLIVYWLFLLICGAFSIHILVTTGFRPASIGRADLFAVRQSVLNPAAVILINLGIFCTALLAQEKRIYALGFLAPIIFEIITQSRGFIVASMFAAFMSGTLPKKYIFLGVAALTAVSISRMQEDLSGLGVLLYLAGESLNTSMGSLLINEGDFSVSVLQASRALFAFTPFLGGALGIESEAIQYNNLLLTEYDLYGMAFGVLGFSKFSTIGVLAVTVIVGLFSLKLLHFLGLNDKYIIIMSGALLPVFFRWSPAEYFYIVSRTGVSLLSIILFVKVLRLGAMMIRRGDKEAALSAG